MKPVNLKKKANFLFLSACLFAALLFVAGCSTGNSSPAGQTLPDFQKEKTEVIARYFKGQPVDEIETRADTIRQDSFNQVNVFSTSHYGQYFTCGTVDLIDVFDARIVNNYEIFLRYAQNSGLVQDPPPGEFYDKYSLVAIAFLREYEYDAVLFYPDEYNPIFTKPSDTWLFLREDPTGPARDYYYSRRIQERYLGMSGGIDMQPIGSFLDWHYFFYIPAKDASYSSYEVHTPAPFSGSTQPELQNDYVPQKASVEIQLKRREAGIIESTFSNTSNLKVGGWKGSYYQNIIDVGFSFSGDPSRFTWSGCGHYLLPLNQKFWNLSDRTGIEEVRRKYHFYQ